MQKTQLLVFKFKTNELRQLRFYQNNKFHREDGPAIVESTGNKEYCIKGTLIHIKALTYEWFPKEYGLKIIRLKGML